MRVGRPVSLTPGPISGATTSKIRSVAAFRSRYSMRGASPTTGTTPGSTTAAGLDLAYLEAPLKDPTSNIDVRAGTRYIARGENDRFQVFDSNGLRYASILVHGGQGSVTLQSFAVQEQVYPWGEGARFTCDDEELNRIFTAGIRTVQLCSHDSFIDCPTREQRAWVGDGVVHQMVHPATNRDWRGGLWHFLLRESPRPRGLVATGRVGGSRA